MIKVHISGNRADVIEREPLTSGTVGKVINFVFTEDWRLLIKYAVFEGSGRRIALTNIGDSCIIPHEVLAKHGGALRVGVYGRTADGSAATPTVYAQLGIIQRGADPNADPSTKPTLPVWAQLQAQIGDLSNLSTEDKTNLVAAINEAAKSGGGGSGGKDGTGIESITYKGEDEFGGNVYTVLLTDGTSYDITAPKGADGAAGADGVTPHIGDNGNWYLGTTDTGKPSRGEKGDTGPSGKDGAKGDPGKAATIRVGNVTTGAAGTPASVSNVGTDEAAIFDFTIPQGEKGADAATDLTLGITGATPGQIAKITAVDTQGKPTAWEPADMAGGGGSGGASSEYKDMVTLVDDTLSDENSGLKNYEYDITGFEPATDLLLISFKFPESFAGQIIIRDQNNQPLTTEFPYDAKAMLVGIKSMNGRVLHMCTSTANAASRMDMNMSMFFGQLSGASGYERSKMPETVTKIKLLTTTVFAAETVIKIMRM